MGVINKQRRSKPPYPDLSVDRDQQRINAQLLDLIKYLERRIEKSSIEERLDKVEKLTQNHDDIING